jgi:hypothetical protein
MSFERERVCSSADLDSTFTFYMVVSLIFVNIGKDRG